MKEWGCHKRCPVTDKRAGHGVELKRRQPLVSVCVNRLLDEKESSMVFYEYFVNDTDCKHQQSEPPNF